MLTSSRKFPSQVNRTMLLMTDMSGPSMISGFETYLTGYALPEIGSYAFGRTWYASEMERPGCVWTHTLLIENSDIGSIADIRSLLRLFRRPHTDSSTWTHYTSSIDIDLCESSDLGESSEFLSNRLIVPKLLLALYGTSANQPIYIPSDYTSTFEDLVLLVWSQQWSTLRTSFFFSTGSIANRKNSQRPFDLQVLSWRSINQLRRDVPSAVIVESDTDEGLPEDSGWIHKAATDLGVGLHSHFRRFLNHYGIDTASTRADFAPLARVFALTQQSYEPATLSKMVRLVAQSFQKPQEAILLKSALLGPARNGPFPIAPDVSEGDILRELATTPFQNSFDHKQMAVRKRAKNLLSTSRSEARRLTIDIFESEITPFGEEFLSGISEAVDLDDAYEFAKLKPQLLNAFTKYNPQLAAMPPLWSSPADQQREFFDIVVANQNGAPELISNMIAAMLDAQSDVLAQEVVDRYKQLAVDGVLKWVDSHLNGADKIGREWFWALRSAPVSLLDSLRQHPESSEQTAAFISGLLDPHSEPVIRAGSEVWAALKKRPNSTLDYKTYIRAMAFLLALGFNNPPLGAGDLVATSFESVHDAAADQSLPQSSWRLLKDQAPDYSSWWSWDKCKRLRCALIERFIRFRWPKQQFLESAHGKTFERVLNNSYDVEGGKDFIREVANESLNGNIHADPSQIRELSHFL